MKKIYLLLGVIAVVLAVDQGTKQYVSSVFGLYESREVIPNFFHITYIHNRGAAFGFLANSDSPWISTFFISITFIATGALLWMYHHAPAWKTFYLVGIALLIGGAFGNFIDRMAIGEVVDFIDVHWYAHHWPAFNFADSAISVGVFLLLVDLFTHR